ncbi:MAG TPA: peroxiredoxin [Candidatus Paenalcaligenes intestinipullorum]|uniref:Glutathione-dependent peroxiredoxin n=1 Tax=Candidatus Paenalcaligenes intestinipullorum TaxID=2838718 RepID=A0A9D2RHA1_9BURK|nr:peroxiredoxin [Candidatus Paenalcaligenes intestinipullorum]
MTIKIGDKAPDATLAEYIDVPTDVCGVGPNAFQAAEALAGKTVALFAVPGAFTPTCSEQHLPGFIAKADEFKGKGVDEIWCMSVNDPFVMGAWGTQQKAAGKVRLIADGNGEWTKKLGLELDLTKLGLGVRSQRFSALIVDGVVKQLNVDEGGALEKSDADTLLGQL